MIQRFLPLLSFLLNSKPKLIKLDIGISSSLGNFYSSFFLEFIYFPQISNWWLSGNFNISDYYSLDSLKYSKFQTTVYTSKINHFSLSTVAFFPQSREKQGSFVFWAILYEQYKIWVHKHDCHIATHTSGHLSQKKGVCPLVLTRTPKNQIQLYVR